MEEQGQQEATNNTEGNAQDGAQAQGTENNVDLSGLMSKDNPEVFDREKVIELHKNATKWNADRQFFQTKYQQSINQKIPENIEDYGKAFKPDSMYEKAMDMEGVKDVQQKLYEHAKKNGIGVDTANSVFDFFMKLSVESGDLDLRTEEQIQSENKILQEEEEKKRLEIIQPMLEDLHRTKDENDAVIKNFINGKNIFTSNPQMKDFLDKVSQQTAIGYQLVTMINNAFDMGNVPTVTGTVASKDKAAFDKAFAAETNPDIRNEMLQQFYGKEG